MDVKEEELLGAAMSATTTMATMAAADFSVEMAAGECLEVETAALGEAGIVAEATKEKLKLSSNSSQQTNDKFT